MCSEYAVGAHLGTGTITLLCAYGWISRISSLVISLCSLSMSLSLFVYLSGSLVLTFFFSGRAEFPITQLYRRERGGLKDRDGDIETDRE